MKNLMFLFLFFSLNAFAAKVPRGALPDEDFLEKLIKKKSYDKAFHSLSRKKIEESKNPYYIIVYDLLRIKLKKKNVKELLCKEEYKKDPDAYNYPTLLCEVLIDYLDDGKIKDKNLQAVEEYFLKHDQHKFYLYHLAHDLKN